MERYLVDTNIISDYFSSSLHSSGIQFLDSVIDAIPKISIITQIELLCWNTDSQTEQKIRNFINDSLVLEINPEVIDECVKLRKSKKIRTPDAIIAATALANSCTIITNNEKDFANIKGLKLINPYML